MTKKIILFTMILAVRSDNINIAPGLTLNSKGEFCMYGVLQDKASFGVLGLGGLTHEQLEKVKEVLVRRSGKGAAIVADALAKLRTGNSDAAVEFCEHMKGLGGLKARAENKQIKLINDLITAFEEFAKLEKVNVVDSRYVDGYFKAFVKNNVVDGKYYGKDDITLYNDVVVFFKQAIELKMAEITKSKRKGRILKRGSHNAMK